MSLPNLYLGDDLVINGVNISFNNANVTVKAPTSALNVSNKNYVDVADASLNALIATEESVRSSEDAKIISSLNRSVVLPLTSGVVGGQAYPAVMPDTVRGLAYDGWYYKKVANDTVNRKINWYVGSDTNMLVSDLKQIYFETHLINKTGLPFITVYTKPTGTGDAASWFKSARTFELINPSLVSTLTNNTPYCFHYKFDSNASDPFSYNHSNKLMSPSDVVANIRGSFLPTEQVLFFSFGTNSGAAIGDVEFICRSISMQSSKGTVNHLLSNIHVDSLALSTQVDNLYQYLFNQKRDGPVPVR
jgi:hypothetical protein